MQLIKTSISFALLLIGSYAQADCTYTARTYLGSSPSPIGSCSAVAGASDNHVSAVGSTFNGDNAGRTAFSFFSNENAIGDFTNTTFMRSMGFVASMSGVLEFRSHRLNASIAGGLSATFRGDNVISNTARWGTPPNDIDPLGNAALYGDARSAAAILTIAPASSLTINQQSHFGYTGSLATRNAGGEGVHLVGSLESIPVDSGAISVNVADDATLDITAKGTGILLEQTGLAAAASSGKGNIEVDLSATSIVRSSTQTNDGAPMAALLAAQLDAGNRGVLNIRSAADLEFDARLAGANRGAAVYALHEGTAMTPQSVDIELTGRQTAWGDTVSGVRALALSGDVKMSLLMGNILRATGLNAKGLFFGFEGNSTEYNPATIDILNQGLVEITGLAGSVDTVGLLTRTNDSAVMMNNMGSVFFRDNTAGYAIRAQNNHNGTGNKNLSISNAGTLGFAGHNIQFGGIDADTQQAGNAIITNSGNIYANNAAIRINAISGTVDNQVGATIVSYLTSSGNTTVNNAGTWIAKNDQNPAIVSFDFGTGSNHFTNTGILALPNTAAANAIAMTTPSDLQPAVSSPLTVPPIAADTAVRFNLGGAANGQFDMGGVVDLQNSSATDFQYTQFTIDGNLESNGGRLLIDTRLGVDDMAGAHSDYLTITGNTRTTLATTIELRNTDGLGAPTTTGIELVKVQGNSVGTEFKLGGAHATPAGFVTAGAYQYRLLRRPFAEDGVRANATWFLANVACVTAPAQVSNPTQTVTISCVGLDKTDIIKMPGIPQAQCIYDRAQSPATGVCTTLARNITNQGGLESGGSVVVRIPNPYARGANGEPVPLFNLFSLLGLAGLMSLIRNKHLHKS